MMFRPATIDAVADGLSGPEDRLRIVDVELPHRLSPLAMVRAAAPFFGSAYTISTPDGTAIGGVGVARRFGAGGPGRFERLRNDLAGFPLPDGARLFVGYSFSPDGPVSEPWSGFDAASIVLPQLTVIRSRDADRLVAALPPGANRKRLLEVMLAVQPVYDPLLPDPGDHAVESHPSPARWREEVGEAVAAIRAGALRKVVLARSVEVRSHASIDGLDLVHHLGERHPQCYTFGWQTGGATFLGASPELLVSRRGMQIRSNPLAGTDRRGTGDEEDRAVGAALMSSAKNRSEHALVIDDVVERLGAITSDLDVPLEPSVRRIASVQHLSTEIRGTLSSPHHLLDVVGLLHPTPAVGGTPRTDAVAFIDKVEEIDRGWYSGGIGWIGPNGDGDVSIALRCGLIRDTTARVYAGSGIVGSSDPEAELAETRLKLRPLLDLLTAR